MSGVGCFYFHVTARGIFNDLEFSFAGLSGWHLVAFVAGNPFPPVWPPGARMLLRAGEPGVRIFRQGVVGPEAILFFVGRVDDTGDVAGAGQNKSDITAVGAGAEVSGVPLGDVVLPGRQEERWQIGRA